MNYPKIGIRPAIDGRWGGVRESLEEQTMGMANAAKELIEAVCAAPMGRLSNVLYPQQPSGEAPKL